MATQSPTPIQGIKMEIKEDLLYFDEHYEVATLPVNGGKIYRYKYNYFRKNQYGESIAVTFVPDSLLTRLKNFIRGLWK